MSDLYKSAIADAKLLKEAAIRSVESVILEKYSGDIKHAVDEILNTSDELYEANETEDENSDKGEDKELFGPNADGSPTNDLPNPDNLGSLTDTADVGTDLSFDSADQDPNTMDTMNASGDAEAKQDATMEQPEEEDDSFPDMPDASMDGESVDGAIQSDGEIEIDLSELEAMANSKPAKVSDTSQDMQSHESILPDLGGSEDAMENPLKESFASENEEEGEAPEAPKTGKDRGKSLIIDDELLEALERELEESEQLDEDLNVDIEDVPTGKIVDTGLTTAERKHELNRQKAAAVGRKEKDTVVDGAALMEAVNRKVGKLTARLNELEKTNKKLTRYNDSVSTKLRETGTRLLEAITTNSKLHYANRILQDRSLNEHQRARLVESLKKANSAEEAKSIFETAQEIIGESRRAQSRSSVQGPTLTEIMAAKNRGSSTMRGSRRVEDQEVVPGLLKESWRKIAGIDK